MSTTWEMVSNLFLCFYVHSRFNDIRLMIFLYVQMNGLTCKALGESVDTFGRYGSVLWVVKWFNKFKTQAHRRSSTYVTGNKGSRPYTTSTLVWRIRAR